MPVTPAFGFVGLFTLHTLVALRVLTLFVTFTVDSVYAPFGCVVLVVAFPFWFVLRVCCGLRFVGCLPVVTVYVALVTLL